MPVRELTEHPQIPRLGKIRLGDRSGRNGAPVNKPFFVVPPEVAEVYGPEPTSLTIVFLSDDPEVIASSYYRAYNATNGLFCKGDGFRANALLDGDELRKAGGSISPLTVNLWAHGKTGGREATTDVVRREIACAGRGYDGDPPCPMFDGKKCAVRSFYQFAVKGVPGLGVYQMDTGSVINTKRMNGAIEMARVMLGGVAGVPMTLSRVQAEVSPDGIQKKIWTVDLKVATEHSLAHLLEFRNGPVAAALLPPVDESEVYEGPGDDTPILEGEYTVPDPDMLEDMDASYVGSPAKPPAREPAAPIDLLNAIEKTHGLPAKQAALQAMTRVFDTSVITRLSLDERADFAMLLRCRLETPQHTHELAYTAKAEPVCKHCGDAMEEPAEAMTPALPI